MTRNEREKKELRQMSRNDTLRVVSEILEGYSTRGQSGTISIDIRAGKAIWVRPKETDSVLAPESSCTLNPMGQVEAALREFEACAASGAITIKVCAGQAVEVNREVELEKVRVG